MCVYASHYNTHTYIAIGQELEAIVTIKSLFPLQVRTLQTTSPSVQLLL